ETNIPDVKGAVYAACGILRRMLGRLEEAEEWFNRCIEVYRETNAAGDIAELHFEIGILEKERGNREKAMEHFNAALEYFEKTKATKRIEKVKKEMG
ncbi:MAG: tetratricopeptide repeat protein, partial [Thermoplasmata archaeon]